MFANVAKWYNTLTKWETYAKFLKALIAAMKKLLNKLTNPNVKKNKKESGS